MKNNVIVFSMKGCPWCTKLKDQLKENNITYLEKDIDDYKDLYDKFVEKTGSDLLPSVIVGKKALVPEKSFKTIEECVTQITKIINE